MTATRIHGNPQAPLSHDKSRKTVSIPAQPVLVGRFNSSREHPLSTTRTVHKGPKVSPVRTIVSLVVLLIVGTVCVIELRAGLGLYLSGKALAGTQEPAAEDPSASPPDPQQSNAPPKPRLEIKRLTMDEARAMISMFPTETVHRESEYEIVYRYQWFSLLRGLIGEKNPEIYIAADKGKPSMYQTFFTDGDEAGGNYVGPSSPDVGGTGLPPEDFTAGGPGGGMGGPPRGMGGRGGMGGPGGGMGGPPGMGGGGGRKGGKGGGGGGGGGGGMRPPAEFPDEPKSDAPPADPAPTDAPKADAPKTEDPKAEDPKAEEPKAEEPKAEEPKAEEPKAEEPKAEEPKAEEPKAEEPKAEEPKAEEPKAEEPKAEEPKADPAPAVPQS